MKTYATLCTIALATLAGCSTVDRTPEEERLARAPNACSSSELPDSKKPIWCEPSADSILYRGPMAVPALVITNPRGTIGGQSGPGGAARVPGG